MEHDAFSEEAVLDLRVPANLASRYRARVVSVSPLEAMLELPFRPVLFRTGVLDSCPATLTVVVGTLSTCVRGTFRMEDGLDSRSARFDFESPLGLRELELLRWQRGGEEPPPPLEEEDPVEPAPYFAS